MEYTLKHLNDTDVWPIVEKAEQWAGRQTTVSWGSGTSAEETLRIILEDDPREIELTQLLEPLSKEALDEMIALMYLGRSGVYRGQVANEMNATISQFHRSDRDHVISTMIEKVPLGEYLRNGMKYISGVDLIDDDNCE